MYLPTFWKLSAEVYMYKSFKAAGWGLPAAAMGKLTYDSLLASRYQTAYACKSEPLINMVDLNYKLVRHALVAAVSAARASAISSINQDNLTIYSLYSCLDRFPIILQLDLLHHHPSQVRCREEKRHLSLSGQICFQERLQRTG